MPAPPTVYFNSAPVLDEDIPVRIGFTTSATTKGVRVPVGLPHRTLATLVGPLVGPLVATVSFVCSIGNVPLAAVLWNGGISFGGVLAFIFADLIILPILDIYRRYYGWRMAAFLLALVVVVRPLVHRVDVLPPGDVLSVDALRNLVDSVAIWIPPPLRAIRQPRRNAIEQQFQLFSYICRGCYARDLPTVLCA